MPTCAVSFGKPQGAMPTSAVSFGKPQGAMPTSAVSFGKPQGAMPTCAVSLRHEDEWRSLGTKLAAYQGSPHPFMQVYVHSITYM